MPRVTAFLLFCLLSLIEGKGASEKIPVGEIKVPNKKVTQKNLGISFYEKPTFFARFQRKSFFGIQAAGKIF